MDQNHKNIHIYYHIFLVNDWKNVLNYHIQSLIDSDLYDNCKTINVGINYKNKNDLTQLYEILKDYNKINILFERHWQTFPIEIFDGVKRKNNITEGETIYRMLRDNVGKNIDNDLFLFFHSKGVSKPNDSDRSQITYFYNKGLDKNADPETKREFIFRDMTYNIIYRWREIVENLKEKEYFNYIWNFFWIRGDLLNKFDFKEFKKAPMYGSVDRRHDTAYFPVNLYSVVHGKNMSIKHIRLNTINTYG